MVGGILEKAAKLHDIIESLGLSESDEKALRKAIREYGLAIAGVTLEG